MRYRLYIDESGDHTYNNLEEVGHRYLGLVGIAIESEYYRKEFQPKLQELKQGHFPHNPDDPVILHREDIYNKRHAFGILRDSDQNASWEKDCIEFIHDSHFRLFGVVIDKKNHKKKYGHSAQHPYHLCLTFLLERYKGYLNYCGCQGDILAESRGKNEDAQLARVYSYVWHHGTFYNSAKSFQSALTSRELKFRKKEANIAGLQLADLLAHPVKMDILSDKGKIDWGDCFGKQLSVKFKDKYNVYGKKLLG